MTKTKLTEVDSVRMKNFKKGLESTIYFINKDEAQTDEKIEAVRKLSTLKDILTLGHHEYIFPVSKIVSFMEETLTKSGVKRNNVISATSTIKDMMDIVNHSHEKKSESEKQKLRLNFKEHFNVFVYRPHREQEYNEFCYSVKIHNSKRKAWGSDNKVIDQLDIKINEFGTNDETRVKNISDEYFCKDSNNKVVELKTYISSTTFRITGTHTEAVLKDSVLRVTKGKLYVGKDVEIVTVDEYDFEEEFQEPAKPVIETKQEQKLQEPKEAPSKPTEQQKQVVDTSQADDDEQAAIDALDNDDGDENE